MKIKLCGIKRPEDVEYVNEFLPDYIGYVFADSRRQVSTELAASLNSYLDPKIKSAGVFVNFPPEKAAETAEKVGLDIIQLHGNEDKNYISALRKMTGCEIWKAVRVRTAQDILNGEAAGADKLLLDSFLASAYGGTGKTADFGIIKNTPVKLPFFLAGGLNSENILSALKEIMPYGADLSGGIETDGLKDREKIKEIINIVRSAYLE